MKIRWYLILFFPLSLWCGNTNLVFGPTSQAVGPFPSNALTVPASNQKTGVQVNLPLPSGCTAISTSTECLNTQLLDQLDGFSINPRIKLCFSGPIDPSTLSGGVSINSVDSVSPAIGIDQILFDPAGNCAYAKPSQVLNQQTRYLLTVTDAVADAGGKRLKADPNYSDCVKKPNTDYCNALANATHQFIGHGNSTGNLIASSLFTTMSATTWLQQARAQVNSGAIPEFVAPAGFVSTFNLSSVRSITWMPQTGVSGVSYDQTLPLNVLQGVDRISFGLYLSPLYVNLAGPQAGTISTTPTNADISNPTAIIPVSFHVFLPPASANPSGKIPVIIYGHGLGDNQFGAPTFAASTWAQKGYATLAIEISGHGYGPLSTTQVVTDSGTFTQLTPGRGIQFNPAAPIGQSDGCILTSAVGTRDCARQTAVDLFAMVRAIRDTGLGLNLDPSRIYFAGQSFGGIYGTLVEAVEPNLSAGTLNAGGGTQTDVARLSPVARQLGAVYLASFAPPLLNVPPAPSQAYFHDSFNDEYVYRGQVVTDSVPGALAIQSAFEESDWMGMLGDPLAYASHLHTAPLAGVPAKQILVQFGLGDLEVPNPTESALVRAGGLQNSTSMLRTDVAASMDPSMLGIATGAPFPIYPHRFLSNPALYGSNALATAIGVAAQKQIADFFTTGIMPDANQYLVGTPFAGAPLFQVSPVLPDGLNFFQIQP